MIAQREVCPRAPFGATVIDPQDFSGSAIGLFLRSSLDRFRQTRYCYVSTDGVESPTIRVHAGDELVLRLTNQLAPDSGGHDHHDGCGPSATMSASSTNLHFHGLDLPPSCHQDETLRTLIPPSGSFEYRIKIPAGESPGLYWYHPHPHGFTEPQVLGGASGALIVEGIEKVKPQVAGLPERVLVLRDQSVAGFSGDAEDAGPGKDISINFVPVLYPLYRPAQMLVRPGEREFWRVLNASADTYFDLQIRFGKTIQDVNDPQATELIAMDGVPVGGESKTNHILLGPGARAEFIVTTPRPGQYGQLVTLKYDTGPDGASTPYRAIANLVAREDAPAGNRIPSEAGSKPFHGLGRLTPARQRTLYFSEDAKAKKYFITEQGKLPKTFDMYFTAPDLTVRHGTVEDWIVENRAQEAHVFHIHQLHFQLMERDGTKIDEPMLRDTVDLPYWDGKSARYPSVKLRMDFRNPSIVGTFVYHCHILEHEDGGMMGSIRVK